MEQSHPWEAESRSAGQQILRVQNSPALDPILNYMNPVHIVNPYFLKMNFNINLQYAYKSFLAFSSLQVFQQTFIVHFLSLSCVLHVPLI
jgi:hypothetical protein